MLPMPQNNCGSGHEHAQLKTVRRLNSGNWCKIQASILGKNANSYSYSKTEMLQNYDNLHLDNHNHY